MITAASLREAMQRHSVYIDAPGARVYGTLVEVLDDFVVRVDAAGIFHLVEIAEIETVGQA